MNCPNCNQIIDNGASFCGNCGFSVYTNPVAPPPQPITYAPPPTVVQPAAMTSPVSQPGAAPNPNNVAASVTPLNPVQPPMQPTYNQIGSVNVANMQPAYALPQPLNSLSRKGETKATVGIIAAVLGLPGALIPIIGLALGITGLVIGTTSRHIKKGLSTATIIVSILAILLSLAAWTYNFTHDPRIKHLSQSTVTKDISTPCYTFKISEDMHVKDTAVGCEFEAMDGESEELSTIVYSIKSVSDSSINASNFESVTTKAAPTFVKAASSQDITFTLSSEKSTTFAGKQAYLIAAKSDRGTQVELVVVLNNAPNGDNIFIIAVGGLSKSTNLSELEKNFTWK